jgi:hypothetical protein
MFNTPLLNIDRDDHRYSVLDKKRRSERSPAAADQSPREVCKRTGMLFYERFDVPKVYDPVVVAFLL